MNIRNKKHIIGFLILFLLTGTLKLFAQSSDTDGDGVSNDKDLCPNTPTGTIVNTYGCPTDLTTCDYSTSSFSTNIVGIAPTETRYILVNSATGVIEQINTTPTFTALSGTKTYMVLAYSYTTTTAGLAVGNQLSAVSASCQDFSNALVVKVCVPVILPTLSINDVTVNENAGTVTLTITALGTSTSPMTVNYATANGAALSGTDYTTTTGTATIPAGSTSVTITIPIVDDAINEITEAFNVNLSSPIGATIADNQGIVTIVDNDPAAVPTLSINDVTVNENAGTVTLTITASGTSTSPMTVNYATANGAALSGTDYTTTTGTATIPAVSTSVTITIPIVDDAINEITETFNVNLSSPVGATTADNQGIVTIVDNDPADDDADKDGVPNDKDLCPNTPIGTIVNTYGCPVSVANCDYSSSSVTFNSAAAPIGKVTKYVLADAADGKIVQVSNTPTFTGLTGTKTYMVLAYSYEDDATIVNLNSNSFLNQVAAACADWSNALVVKICVPFVGNGNCDYTTSSITLNLTTPAPSAATTKYILINQSGIIVQVSNTPTFTGLSGTNVYNVYAISYTGTINNLTLGSNFSSVSGTCYDWSEPLSIKVCVCKPNICIPIVINKIK